jgi:hypothetical protein
MSTLIELGNDLGMGANKLFGEHGGLETIAQVSLNGGTHMGQFVGLGAQAKTPLHIQCASGSFYVGAGAHDWGRPVENLGYDQLMGAPGAIALLCASLTNYIKRYGPFTAPIQMMVGLPIELLSGEEAQANAAAVQAWLTGTHAWVADGQSYTAEIAEVKITSQPVGAMFDHMLDDAGKVRPSLKGLFAQEVGILSVGFNTVELLVVRDRKPIQRFTAGATVGVRRLLEIVNGQRLYSLGELDARLRAGQLDVSSALPIWERALMGQIEQQWGTAWRRFAAVLIVGGGAVLLRDTLPHRFGGKAIVPDNPVLSIANGLYKLALSQQGRKRV